MIMTPCPKKTKISSSQVDATRAQGKSEDYLNRLRNVRSPAGGEINRVKTISPVCSLSIAVVTFTFGW